METVRIKTVSGQAKVSGTLLCVGGSMLMTFYKGSIIKLWGPHVHWRYAATATTASASTGDGHHMALGAVLVIASCFAWAVWFIIQAKMCKSFASPYTSSTLLCFMAGMQCFIIGSVVHRKWSVWALGWDIRLAAVLYIGVVGSGMAFALMSWCIERRGPLFVSMFSPLLLVIVAILGWAILDEKLFLGSVVGSVLIVGGLYVVLWGKGREMAGVEGSKTKGQQMIRKNSDIDAIATVPDECSSAGVSTPKELELGMVPLSDITSLPLTVLNKEEGLNSPEEH